MTTNKSPKIPKTNQCDLCNLVTCSYKDYKRHLSTIKHINKQMATNGNLLAIEKIPNTLYQCEKCNKNY
jgi:hypothetical protein